MEPDKASALRTGTSSDLVGGFLTRGDVLSDRELTLKDQETLQTLKLSPCFVGVERSAIQAALGGGITRLRDMQMDTQRWGDLAEVRLDGGGTAVIRFQNGQAEIIRAVAPPKTSACNRARRRVRLMPRNQPEPRDRPQPALRRHRAAI